MASIDYEALNADHAEADNDPYTVERYQRFAALLPPRAIAILDIGCGSGRGGAALASVADGLRLTGLDCVRRRVNEMPSAYGQCLYALLPTIPCADGSFDVVVAGEVVEHLYPSDAEATLRECFRVLRPGGRLLLTTPNPSDIKRRLRGTSIIGGAHVSQYRPDHLGRLLLQIGFTRPKVEGCGKMTRHIGHRMPLFLYGSYLLYTDKP